MARGQEKKEDKEIGTLSSIWAEGEEEVSKARLAPLRARPAPKICGRRFFTPRKLRSNFGSAPS